MVTCKSTVRFKGFTPELVKILGVLCDLDADKVQGQPADLVITSANDSTHKPNSKHYANKAVDVRSKTFTMNTALSAFKRELEQALGDGYLVLLESSSTPNEHFHIQAR